MDSLKDDANNIDTNEDTNVNTNEDTNEIHTIFSQSITNTTQTQTTSTSTSTSTSKTTNINDMITIVNDLYKKYNNDSFFLSMLEINVKKLEDKILSQKEEYEYRQERKNKLHIEKDVFIEQFLQTHTYYYIPESDIYIEYTNTSYNQISENKIWIDIYNNVNKNKTLLPWKHKVRVELMSHIKKNTIYTVQVIPESTTIQRVLQILQSILLPDKYTCKYFLTLLGDSLLKKNDSNHIIITTNNCEKFINTLEFQIHHYMKCYVKDVFKTKYHNHHYENIRILQTKECEQNAFIWESTVKKFIFDIIFVACHYSNRFESADSYAINFCNNAETAEGILFCCRNTKKSIMDSFIENMFERNDTLCVFKKDLKYLINQYFDLINIPKVLFYTDVDEYFKENFEEINEHEITMYKGITAKDSHFISSFLSFFDEYFTIDDTTTNLFELDEILLIYTKLNKHTTRNYLLNEKMVISLMKHYYENIIVMDNKFVKHLTCKIWNKSLDIQSFMHTQNETNTIELTHDKLYEGYCVWCGEQKKQFVVSKEYFIEHI